MPVASSSDRQMRRAMVRYLPEGRDGELPAVMIAGGLATVVCRTRRADGAAAALALAERVGALFRGRTVGPARFGAPSVDLDGRDPAWFRAVVTLPFRRDPAGRGRNHPSRRPP